MDGMKSVITVLVLGGIGIALIGKASRWPEIITSSGASFERMYEALSGRSNKNN